MVCQAGSESQESQSQWINCIWKLSQHKLPACMISRTCDGEDADDDDEDEDGEVEVPVEGLLDEEGARVQVHLDITTEVRYTNMPG